MCDCHCGRYGQTWTDCYSEWFMHCIDIDHAVACLVKGRPPFSALHGPGRPLSGVSVSAVSTAAECSTRVQPQTRRHVPRLDPRLDQPPTAILGVAGLESPRLAVQDVLCILYRQVRFHFLSNSTKHTTLSYHGHRRHPSRRRPDGPAHTVRDTRSPSLDARLGS